MWIHNTDAIFRIVTFVKLTAKWTCLQKLLNSCIIPHIAFEHWISIPPLFGCCAKEHCIQNFRLIGVCDSRLFRSDCRRNEEEYFIPAAVTPEQATITYANEAEILNTVLGTTPNSGGMLIQCSKAIWVCNC